MKKIIIFGNSGSGKSTLAKQIVSQYNLHHMDLDTLAWQRTTPPTRKPLEESTTRINCFINNYQQWVIEGCYSDLLDVAIKKATEIIFLNLDTQSCINNCKIRPWEPHKYHSAEKQNENLEMLLEWVTQYSKRNDEFSLKSHQRLFNSFHGDKTQYTSNNRS